MRTRFDEVVRFKGPPGFLSAVAAAAFQDHTSVSEFLRRTVIARLREVGVPIEATREDD
jgi:hypothetical protein